MLYWFKSSDCRDETIISLIIKPFVNLNQIRVTRDFELLLEDQAPLEAYIEWLDSMVDKCVVQKSQREPGNMRRIARQFLLMWSCFGTRIIRDMTLHSAPSFGSYHLLHLMFDEYVLYTVERLHNQDKGNQLFRAAKGEISLDIVDVILKTDPHPGKSSYINSSHMEDRTSVIRGPEYALQNTATTKPLSHLEDRIDVPGRFTGFQTFTATDNTKLNGFHSVNNSTPWHVSNGINSTNQPADKNRIPTTFMHPPGISQTCMPETFTGCNSHGENNYAWYDWTEGNSNNNNNNNITSAVIPSISLMGRNQNIDSRISLRADHSHNSHNVNTDLNDFGFCHDQQFRRQGVNSQTNKRKLCDELPALNHRPDMSDFYQHHVTNLI